VDGYGNAVTTTQPTRVRNAWTISTTGDGENALSAVSCPSPSLCAAAGDVLATSTDPADASRAWTVRHSTTLSASVVSALQPGLSVSCPSISLCVAGDGAGDILTSTAPADPAGTWAAGNVLPPVEQCDPYNGCTDVPQPINGLSCPTSGLCVAVASDGFGDGQVLTSTDPAAGAHTWRASPPSAGSGPLPGGAFGVTCPSSSLCVATGAAIASSTNPTAGLQTYRAHPVGGDVGNFYGVSCPSVTLCVAVGTGPFASTPTDPTAPGDGIVSTSSDPGAGATAWSTAVPVERHTILEAVSCPSVSLCVAIDNHGDAVTSTDPTNPAAWKITHADSAIDLLTGQPAALTGVSCPSATVCIAVDSAGNVISATVP
jgi:hypothetical protein